MSQTGTITQHDFDEFGRCREIGCDVERCERCGGEGSVWPEGATPAYRDPWSTKEPCEECGGTGGRQA